MSQHLTGPQKAVLVRAGKSLKSMTRGVRKQTGEALQAKGYGHYHEAPHKIFYLNGAGLNFALYGTQIKE